MFELVGELYGHQGDIRGLAALPGGRLVSGSRDRIGKVWRPVREGKGYEEVAALLEHEHWVSVVLALPGSLGFVTGCQDHKIRWYDGDGNIKGTLLGHEGPVSSLDWNTASEELVSGSWDGTARIWDLSSGTCKSVLPGHENGVCVLALPNGSIATGSAGVQRNNRVEGFQVRLWRDGQQLSSLKEHQGAVRSLCRAAADGATFASTSNDGTVRVWPAEGGASLATMSNPPGPEGSPAFNFCVAAADGFSRLAVASDDCCVRIWNPETGSMEEEIAHPCTVWCVVQLENGDFATGGSDGVVRVFSRDASRHAPGEVREGYLNEALKRREAIANKASNGGQKIDPSKLAKIYEAKPGGSDGEVKMFNKEGQAWVYSWSASSQTWIEVGEVMGDAGGKEMIDGVEYDKVVPVEIEDPSSGGVRKLQLGFNNEDSPYVVAQQFVAKHELSEHHTQQIAEFVQNVRGQASGPPTIDMSGGGAASGASAGAGAGASASATTSSSMEVDEGGAVGFPLQFASGVAFEAGDLDKIMSKLEEVNASLAEASLSDKELAALREVCATLKQTSRYHATTVDAAGVRALLRAFADWDLVEGFPVMDVLRLVLTHPDGSAKVAATGRVGDILTRSLAVASAKGSESAAPLAPALVGARVAANVFRHPPTADAAVKALDGAASAVEDVAEPLRALTEFPNKNVRAAAATCLMNCANKLAHTRSVTTTTETRQGLLRAAVQAIEACASQGAKEGEAARKAALAAGCLLVLDSSLEGDFDGLAAALSTAEGLDVPALTTVCDNLRALLRRRGHK
ncbi:Guanine nucleotide-binding protein subunit beta-2-like 1 [Hondaea fermentalgiana]|uniref:Guanine nucleotide-binding protein subunit beta-2-like 1 n=1 Tax=Hondaea fermentalgiana TaxID=2315210 RepID=A0A2R5GH77_9STRA|nr:Guanine nucleotide-binding protein subunit beta-2-like 1 [Hondaea fermentalgiana]|eukprot:GBG29098.1 Guanine nucleotide-binding protein subunit beta-2-like 1 [Hondaea fermentalgiana]